MAIFYDILIGEYLKNPGRKDISLEDLAKNELNYQTISLQDISLKGELDFENISLKSSSNYLTEKVFIIKELYKLQEQSGQVNEKILNEIDMPLVEVLAGIELNGVKIDSEMLKEVGEKLKIEIKIEQQKIFEIANQEFNINSPKQVGEILFEKLGIKTSKKTKTGYSVDNEVLENLSIDFPIAKHILNYRQYSKLLSTYIEGLIKFINPKTKKVHTSYNQTITTTGRLSSTNPNLQNIPSSSAGVSGEIRKAFVCFDENDLIMTFDYSQIEVRLLAIMSGDENLIGAFKSGVDIHSNTGYFLFGKDDLTSDERRIAKAVNFGVIYGISAFGLSKMIGLSQKESQEYINKFYDRYPKVLEYFNKIITDCEKNGYVETMFGRKRFISGINDRNAIIKKASQREAINMPIQGTSADIIKIAMIKINNFLKNNHLKTKMIMQVHDELVFNVDAEEKDLIKSQIKNIMENIIGDQMILKVDVGEGKNWKEAK